MVIKGYYSKAVINFHNTDEKSCHESPYVAIYRRRSDGTTRFLYTTTIEEFVDLITNMCNRRNNLLDVERFEAYPRKSRHVNRHCTWEIKYDSATYYDKDTGEVYFTYQAEPFKCWTAVSHRKRHQQLLQLAKYYIANKMYQV